MYMLYIKTINLLADLILIRMDLMEKKRRISDFLSTIFLNKIWIFKWRFKSIKMFFLLTYYKIVHRTFETIATIFT